MRDSQQANAMSSRYQREKGNKQYPLHRTRIAEGLLLGKEGWRSWEAKAQLRCSAINCMTAGTWFTLSLGWSTAQSKLSIMSISKKILNHNVAGKCIVNPGIDTLQWCFSSRIAASVVPTNSNYQRLNASQCSTSGRKGIHPSGVCRGH